MKALKWLVVAVGGSLAPPRRVVMPLAQRAALHVGSKALRHRRGRLPVHGDGPRHRPGDGDHRIVEAQAERDEFAAQQGADGDADAQGADAGGDAVAAIGQRDALGGQFRARQQGEVDRPVDGDGAAEAGGGEGGYGLAVARPIQPGCELPRGQGEGEGGAQQGGQAAAQHQWRLGAAENLDSICGHQIGSRAREGSSSLLQKRTKKFLPVASTSRVAHFVRRLRARSKSFLFLFFKKEILLFLLRCQAENSLAPMPPAR
jgi:hypothetical protein